MIEAIIVLVIIVAIFGKSDNKSSHGIYKKNKKYNQPSLTKKEIKQIEKTIRRQQEEAELDMFATIEAFMDD